MFRVHQISVSVYIYYLDSKGIEIINGYWVHLEIGKVNKTAGSGQVSLQTSLLNLFFIKNARGLAYMKKNSYLCSRIVELTKTRYEK